MSKADAPPPTDRLREKRERELQMLVEHGCSFGCDAESRCRCVAHRLYELAMHPERVTCWVCGGTGEDGDESGRGPCDNCDSMGWIESALRADTEGPRVGDRRELLKAAFVLMRPWMDGGVTWEQWSAAYESLAEAVLVRETGAAQPATQPTAFALNRELNELVATARELLDNARAQVARYKEALTNIRMYVLPTFGSERLVPFENADYLRTMAKEALEAKDE